MALAYSYVLGRDAACYFNTANKLVGDVSPGGAPPFTNLQYAGAWLGDAATIEALNLMDTDQDMGSEFADATTRETARSGFISQVPVIRRGQITFDIKWIPGDGTTVTFTDLMMAAVESGQRIALGFLCLAKNHNPGAGKSVVVDGPVGNFNVSVRKTEALKDIQKGSVTLGVADTMSWYRTTRVGS